MSYEYSGKYTCPGIGRAPVGAGAGLGGGVCLQHREVGQGRHVRADKLSRDPAHEIFSAGSKAPQPVAHSPLRLMRRRRKWRRICLTASLMQINEGEVRSYP